MDELIREIQDELPRCVLFADDIVLINETREGLNNKLEQWRRNLESKGFRLNKSKIKYPNRWFNGVEKDGGESPRGEW